MLTNVQYNKTGVIREVIGLKESNSLAEGTATQNQCLTSNVQTRKPMRWRPIIIKTRGSICSLHGSQPRVKYV